VATAHCKSEASSTYRKHPDPALHVTVCPQEHANRNPPYRDQILRQSFNVLPSPFLLLIYHPHPIPIRNPPPIHDVLLQKPPSKTTRHRLPSDADHRRALVRHTNDPDQRQQSGHTSRRGSRRWIHVACTLSSYESRLHIGIGGG